MSALRRVERFLRELYSIKFILLMGVVSYFVVIPYLVTNLIAITGISHIDTEGISTFWLIVALIVGAPIVFVLIFQYLPFMVLNRFLFIKKRPLIIILISAVLYAMIHEHSIGGILYGFIIGMILATSYWIYERELESSYWVTVGVQVIVNVPVVIVLIVNSFT